MIKVLIVDDSAIVRRILTDGLNKINGIEVVGSARDAYVARDKIVKLEPDVLTLDIQMPRMDGLTFLEKLMTHYPMPVVVISSLSQKGSATTMKAFDLGAVEVIGKPDANVSSALSEMILMLGDKIKAAAAAKNQIKKKTPAKPTLKESAIISNIKATNKILAIGASTGGTQALSSVFSKLPATTPATVIVQHMPAYFTQSFAERLNLNSAMEVREAKDGDMLRQGLALLAPGNFHMLLKKSGTKFFVEVKDGPLVCRQRPAVDVLFKSVARYAGINSVGVILTGMGNDGASGLLEMKNAGAQTIGQDEKSCVVYGMPRKAAEAGAVDIVVSLDLIPKKIVECFT